MKQPGVLFTCMYMLPVSGSHDSSGVAAGPFPYPDQIQNNANAPRLRIMQRVVA